DRHGDVSQGGGHLAAHRGRARREEVSRAEEAGGPCTALVVQAGACVGTGLRATTAFTGSGTRHTTISANASSTNTTRRRISAKPLPMWSSFLRCAVRS